MNLHVEVCINTAKKATGESIKMSYKLAVVY
jgi:hypothetical protein